MARTLRTSRHILDIGVEYLNRVCVVSRPKPVVDICPLTLSSLFSPCGGDVDRRHQHVDGAPQKSLTSALHMRDLFACIHRRLHEHVPNAFQRLPR